MLINIKSGRDGCLLVIECIYSQSSLVLPIHEAELSFLEMDTHTSVRFLLINEVPGNCLTMYLFRESDVLVHPPTVKTGLVSSALAQTFSRRS